MWCGKLRILLLIIVLTWLAVLSNGDTYSHTSDVGSGDKVEHKSSLKDTIIKDDHTSHNIFQQTYEIVDTSANIDDGDPISSSTMDSNSSRKRSDLGNVIFDAVGDNSSNIVDLIDGDVYDHDNTDRGIKIIITERRRAQSFMVLMTVVRGISLNQRIMLLCQYLTI